MLSTILAEREKELDALTVEIFATTYGDDWQDAFLTAQDELPALLDYAAEWDAELLAQDEADPVCELCGDKVFVSCGGHLYCKAQWQQGECTQVVRWRSIKVGDGWCEERQ